MEWRRHARARRGLPGMTSLEASQTCFLRACWKVPSRSARSGRATRAKSRAPPTKLSSDTQSIDYVVIPVYIALFEVLKQTPALADHLQKATPRMIVLHVSLKVSLQFIDPLRENRYLNLWRACIGIVNFVVADNVSLCFFC